MSKILTTIDLQTYMIGQTLDSGLAAQVAAGINAWIETETGRCFGETKQVTERYNWTNVVWLRHQDIVSIDELTLGWPGQTNSIIDPSGYYFNPLGRVTLYTYANGNMSRLYNDYLSVKYTYGVETVPDDLKMAALGIAAGFYNWASNGQKDIVSSQVGSYQLEYIGKVRAGSIGPDPANNTADANWEVIKSYKLRRQ